METSSLSSLHGLTELGMRSGVDMRPTLLRVLTDLYVQRLTHTPDEERHYTELALRLLEAVDVQTRSAVAARLSGHLSPPARVVQFLAADLPAVAAALQVQPAAFVASAGAAKVPARDAPGAPITNEPTPHAALDQEPAATDFEEESVAEGAPTVGADAAGELNDLFFGASANERRLILLNLDVVAALPAERSSIRRDAAIGQRLETAVLGRNHEEFSQSLARSLRISREQAQRIASDELGEPIVVAAKALGIARDVLYRILLFVNTAIGHSVERVHALAELYDELTPQAAEDMVAIWQGLNHEPASTPYQPGLWTDDTRVGVRSGIATAQRVPAPSRISERREAS